MDAGQEVTMKGKVSASNVRDAQQAAHQPAWLQALWLLPVLLLSFGAPFIGAWTFAWPVAWVCLGLTLAGVVGSRVAAVRAHPDLFEERSQFTANEGTKSWDRLIVPFIGIVGPIIVGLVAGLNHRFAWPPALSLPVQVVGAAGLLFGLALSTWAMVANRFFSSVVRIQAERGHRVVDAGPYHFVRHPGYAGGTIGQLGIALMLGSVWALVPAGLVALAYVLRTALEDRTLQAELFGYREYAARVRWRLLPGIW
jgi:protein-S-isoprenylcysteine O-methyltransferase Ste14